METISLNKLLGLFGCSKSHEDPELTGFSESFKLIDSINPKYVEPFFKKCYGDDENPQIILVTAAGAVGKSELTAYISSKLRIPVLDLALHPPVGDSTLTGVISKTFDSKKEVRSALTNGKYGIIIDALDEGCLKVRHDAFLSFLDDIALWTDPAQNVASICLLGRTNIMEETALYLEEKGLKVLMIQIEPFTIPQAEDFLYKQVIGDNKNKYEESFKKVRDYILESIDGFFKNQGESAQSSCKNFIGYAPVLLAIAKLLKQDRDYHSVYNRLQEKGDEKVRMLVNLTQDILLREQQKIIDNLSNSLFSDFDDSLSEIARTECYCEKEQIIRLCGRIMGFETNIRPTGVAAFDEQYETIIQDFLKEHPFLSDRQIINVVFESYLIAKISSYGNEFTKDVNRYIKTRFRNSFAFYPIVHTMFEMMELPLPGFLFGPVYSSLVEQTVKALDTEVDIYQIEDSDNFLMVSFENENEKLNCEFRMNLGEDGTLDIGGKLGNATLEGEFDILFSGPSVTLTTPVSIVCRDVYSSCTELLIQTGQSVEFGKVLINCNSINNDLTESGAYTKILNKGSLTINCPSKPEYPFAPHYSGSVSFTQKIDQQKFLKLTNIISQFRGHKKKGDWAKSKDKIDRRFETGIGLQVKEALITNEIIYPEGHLYKLNQNKMREILNLSYADMLEGKSNDKVNEFISSI